MPVVELHTAPCWGVWKMEESSDILLSLLEERQACLLELAGKRTEVRKQEWLAVRVLLQQMLGRPVSVAYHPNGAPYLPSESLFISISHTKGYVAVRLQEHPAAGIDIEHRSDRVLKIRSRFMNPAEEVGIDRTHEAEHLLVHWCAKETLFKMIGQEQVDFCKHLHICPFEFAPQGTFTVYETRTDTCERYTLGYQIYADFVLVWSN